mgnify:CR=1 FL=1
MPIGCSMMRERSRMRPAAAGGARPPKSLLAAWATGRRNEQQRFAAYLRQQWDEPVELDAAADDAGTRRLLGAAMLAGEATLEGVDLEAAGTPLVRRVVP